MERKKILFLDVDGTLVDYAGRIPASAVKAVRLAREKGHILRSGISVWTG